MAAAITVDDSSDASSSEAASIDVTAELKNLLYASDYAGRFATSGQIPFIPAVAPNITVAGVGKLKFPLSASQANDLREAPCCEVAPYGKGSATLVDTAVRDAHQIDSSHITITASWNKILDQLVTSACKKLDVKKDALGVEAHLYKLVLYGPGGHFLAHQDTEKEPGMFGTLLIQLPSSFKGGNLTIEHVGKKVVHEFGGPDSSEFIQYAAFFADCQHELSRVKSGNRIILAYNLVSTTAGGGSTLTGGKVGASKQRLTSIVERWEAREGAPPPMFAIRLEHEYTETNRTLKGRDAYMADLLLSCPKLRVELCLGSRHKSGTPAPDYDMGYHRYRPSKRPRRSYSYSEDDDDDDDGVDGDSDEFGDDSGSSNEEDDSVPEIDDVIDDEVTLTWTTLSTAVDDLDIDFEELFDSADALDACTLDGAEIFDKPSSRDYEGYMGNYGPTLDYWYQSALLVCFPISHAAAVVTWANKYGNGDHDALEYINEQLKKGWTGCVPDMVKSFARFAAEDDVYGDGDLNREIALTTVLLRRLGRSAPPSTFRRICTQLMTAMLPGVASGKLARETAIRLMTVVSAHKMSAECLHALMQLCTRSANTALPFACGLAEAAPDSSREKFWEAMFNTLDSDTTWQAKKETLLQYAEMVWPYARGGDADSVRAIMAAVPESRRDSYVHMLMTKPLDMATDIATSATCKAAVSAGDRHAVKLVQACIDKVCAAGATAAPPLLEWSQPKAVFPWHDDIQAFLRGPNRSAVISGFNSIAHARSCAECCIRPPSSHEAVGAAQRSYGYDVRYAHADGAGRKAYVELQKGDTAYRAALQHHTDLVTKLRKLRETLAKQEVIYVEP